MCRCDGYRYTGLLLKSGKKIELTGTTWHTLSPDGTPSRFCGYKFRNGDVTYLIGDEGTLLIVQGDKTLVNEKGEWQK